MADEIVELNDGTDDLIIVGIDLGTTNTAVARLDTTVPEEEVRIEAENIPQLVNPGELEARALLPSFLYVPGELDFTKGSLALPWEAQPEFVMPIWEYLAGLVTDGAYAALGVGDTAVGALKGVPGQVERLRRETPRTVETRVRDVERRVKTLWAETPQELKARLEAARKSAETEFDAYAKRGRSVASSITRSPATRRALAQARTARSQVKAAATSVRKALGESAEAVETAAEKVGEEQSGG